MKDWSKVSHITQASSSKGGINGPCHLVRSQVVKCQSDAPWYPVLQISKSRTRHLSELVTFGFSHLPCFETPQKLMTPEGSNPPYASLDFWIVLQFSRSSFKQSSADKGRVSGTGSRPTGLIQFERDSFLWTLIYLNPLGSHSTPAKNFEALTLEGLGS